MTEEENTFKISIPLITDEEIRHIDNNFESIVDKFSKLIVHDKELAIAQHIMQKQQEEINYYKKQKKHDDWFKEELLNELRCLHLTKEDIKEKLKQARKEYSKTETKFNKEYNPIQKANLKEKLIRLDERIEVYKEILK